jgi:hypothetical protein
LTEKLTPREKSALLKAVEMPKSAIDLLRNLEPQAQKLEQTLKSARVKKPSHVYEILADASPSLVVFLLADSTQKTVHERIRNYLQKYLPAMQEALPSDWEAIEGQPGTHRYLRNRKAFVASRLDVRPRKQAKPEAEPVAPIEMVERSRAR